MNKAQKTWLARYTINHLIAFISIFAYSFAVIAAINPVDLEGYEVDFDSPGREKEIEIVYQHLIRDPLKDTEFLTRESILVDIYDIDNDGKEEIIYIIYNSAYCGNRGCTFNILKQSNKKTLQGNPIYLPIRWSPKENDTSGLVINKIRILKTTTLGVHDLLLDDEVIWKWYGNYYDRYKSLDELQD